MSAQPLQILLVGREGSGKRTLFESLLRIFPSLEEHTNLQGAGLRTLGLQVGSVRLSLLDIAGSNHSALASASRLRKAIKHFDSLAGRPAMPPPRLSPQPAPLATCPLARCPSHLSQATPSPDAPKAPSTWRHSTRSSTPPPSRSTRS